jgi:hypothetical protein
MSPGDSKLLWTNSKRKHIKMASGEVKAREEKGPEKHKESINA